jgi:leucyl/phenylalanyl-tRNA--protein transferase
MLDKVIRRTARYLLPRIDGGGEVGQQVALNALPFCAETVIKGYLNGFFPMANPQGDVHWRAPSQRCVMPIHDFHVSKNLKRLIRQQKFEIRVDTCFEEVIRGCADRAETWITDNFIETYQELHELGVARSVEAFVDGELVGGIYGISIGKYFATESQFHRVSHAGKLAFIYAAEILKSNGYKLHDVQYQSPFLEQFGALEIPDTEFRRELTQAVVQQACFESPTELTPAAASIG